VISIAFESKSEVDWLCRKERKGGRREAFEGKRGLAGWQRAGKRLGGGGAELALCTSTCNSSNFVAPSSQDFWLAGGPVEP
jgi:hypothetical protein